MGGVISYTFDATTERLITFGKDGTIRFLDFSSRSLEKIKQDLNKITPLAFNSLGLNIAVGCSNFTIKLFDIATIKNAVKILNGHNCLITSLTFNPINPYELVSGDKNGTVYSWNISNGDKQLLQEKSPGIKKLLFNKNATKLIAYHDRCSVTLWKFPSQAKLHIFNDWTVYSINEMKEKYINEEKLKCCVILDITEDNQILYTVKNEEGETTAENEIINKSELDVTPYYSGHEGASYREPFNMHSLRKLQLKCFVIGKHTDSLLKIIKQRNHAPFDVISLSDIFEITDIRFHPLNNSIIIGRNDGKICAFNNMNVQPVMTFEVAAGIKISGISIDPAGLYILSTETNSQDISVRLFHLQSFFTLLKRELPKDSFKIPSTIFAPDRKHLISVEQYNDGYYVVSVWNVDDWKIEHNSCKISSALTKSAMSCTIETTIDSITYYLSIGGSAGLHLWKIINVNNKIHSQVYWKTGYSGLSSDSIKLKRVTGLSKLNYNVLSQSSVNPIIGRPSDNNSNVIIKHRNEQKYVSQGFIRFTTKDGSTYDITSQQWIISIVREKKPCLEGTQSHTWLLIQGLNDESYTVNQELHFYLNTHSKSYLDVVGIGKGTIAIKDRSPWDLKAQEKLGNLISLTWSLSREEAEKLIENVKMQPSRGYIVSGRSPAFFGSSHLNCLTWCLEQLSCIKRIREILPAVNAKDSILTKFLNRLTDFVAAIPEHYLVDEGEVDNDELKNSTCLIL